MHALGDKLHGFSSHNELDLEKKRFRDLLGVYQNDLQNQTWTVLTPDTTVLG